MSINNNNSTNNANYDLPPIRKIGPAVLPKPKNIKIQAGRATINVSADGGSNRPTITITTSRGSSSSASSPNSPNSSSSQSFTYNIPIHHLQQQQQQQQQQAQEPNQTLNNHQQFIIKPAELQRVPYLSTSSNNTNNGNSFLIPVSMKLTNANFNENMNSNNGSPTTKSFNINLSSSGNLIQQLNNLALANTNNNLTNNLNKGNVVINNSLRNQSEDEVDMLRDILMKNLYVSTQQNDTNLYGSCFRCNQNIYGAENGLRAMDHLFHVNCFNCFACGSLLHGKHFYALDQKSFCESCYLRLLDRCSICSNPITEKILRANGKTFHPECFCCFSCHKSLDGIPFTVDQSNKIHCIECFHDKYAPRCYICHMAITPENGQEETVRIVALGQSFHVNCYKCEDCGVSLASNADNAGGCFPLNDHIYCKNCNLTRLRGFPNAQGYYYKLPGKQIASNITPRSTDL